MNIFSDSLDVQFEALGSPVTYTPDGGNATEIKVIPKRPDEVAEFGEVRVAAETAMFDIRVAEISNPQEGDQITFDGTNYTIQGEPVRNDSDRLIWTVNTRPG